MSYSSQFLLLLILAIPIACISWTSTHEELDVRICFSHYLTLIFLVITKFKLLFDDWRGYLISGFTLLWSYHLHELVRTNQAGHQARANRNLCDSRRSQRAGGEAEAHTRTAGPDYDLAIRHSNPVFRVLSIRRNPRVESSTVWTFAYILTSVFIFATPFNSDCNLTVLVR